MLRSLLLASDFSERPNRSLRRAVLLARQLPARLSLVHVVNDDQAENNLDSFTTTLAERTGVAPDSLQQLVRAQRHSIAEEILKSDSNVDADLLVVANRNRSALDRIFLGSVSSAVLKDSERDVLVPPAQTTATKAICPPF